MLDKRTFCKLIDDLDDYVAGMRDLETSLGAMFDNNFMTKHLDNSLNIISEAFFTQEQIDDLESLVAIETVKDIVYHYAFTGEFGLKTSQLQRLYIEDENMSTEFAMNAFNSEQLYDVIVRYLNPPNVCKTYTIHC